MFKYNIRIFKYIIYYKNILLVMHLNTITRIYNAIYMHIHNQKYDWC